MLPVSFASTAFQSALPLTITVPLEMYLTSALPRSKRPPSFALPIASSTQRFPGV